MQPAATDSRVCCVVLCALRAPCRALPCLAVLRCSYAERQVQRQLSSKRVKLPDSWQAELAKYPDSKPTAKVRQSRRQWVCD